jgi:hypothetical protein
MDDHLPPPAEAGTELTLRGNLLGPGIRRDIADLNRQFLALSLEPALAGDPRFGLAPSVCSTIGNCQPEVLERLAQCPFSLFELRLPEQSGPTLPPTGWVADALQPPLVDAMTAARCQAFVLLSLSVARRLAEGVPLSPRIALGVSAPVEARLAAMSPSELVAVAGWPGLVRPRWSRHAHYWGMLVAAAQETDPGAMVLAHWVGLCLPATGAATPEAPAASIARRRARHSRGWPGPGVSC